LTQVTKARFEKICADGSYGGKLVDCVWQHLEIVLETVTRDPSQKGFQVLRRRWVVERIFTWLGC
jgi:transposase